MSRLLPAFVLACALLAIGAGTWLPQWPALYGVAKATTTALIIAWAWGRGRPGSAVHRALLAGLMLSWCGDVALLWPREGFLLGLVAFLLAHLAYLVAFTRVARLAARPLSFAAYAVVAGAILWALWPGVPVALRAPVVAYVVCLASMAAQAAVVWRCTAPGPERSRAGVLALGGALFVASDALLATNRFAAALPWANLFILATYWSAQMCIAQWLPPRR